MNSYSLSSDSRRWWWPSAAAGSAGAAAIAAILIVPAAVQAQPEPIAPAEPAYSVYIGEGVDRPCFAHRSTWNEAPDGHQPRCYTQTGTPASGGIAVEPTADEFTPRPNAW
ncbi:hypothetical protein [Nocardioides sp. B-3]|uniref:hypothetical protein n=1 Tax=Nocardioides sp. B-3 TaxID=2895565 RepID=UPI002152CE0C|nr:hypothetical protein [Nocardioides sp. B-3]UUZ57701.1 hypothetical protein LP418_14785 [Nocardioides sp. B-3]